MAGAKEASQRRRGRPTGRNRIPLSLEERRARNAQYERERRNEASDAIDELADAIGEDPGMPQKELLATVVNYLERVKLTDPSEDLQTLRLQNQKLMDQIQSIEQRMETDPQLKGLANSEESQKPMKKTLSNKREKKRVQPDFVPEHQNSEDIKPMERNVEPDPEFSGRKISSSSSLTSDGDLSDNKKKKLSRNQTKVDPPNILSEDLLVTDYDSSTVQSYEMSPHPQHSRSTSNSSYDGPQNSKLMPHQIKNEDIKIEPSPANPEAAQCSLPNGISYDRHHYGVSNFTVIPNVVPDNFMGSDDEEPTVRCTEVDPQLAGCSRSSDDDGSFNTQITMAHNIKIEETSMQLYTPEEPLKSDSAHHNLQSSFWRFEF